ncbi:hypothetical protein AC792_10660 [Arthrobacter sp. RIT-PI-e]|uniref:CHRD domain-containing protein n=1 Tax=Arthrobacter sp. RIT-PI-e TaxID=1681197 RepID=UPI0006768FFD|nr:CHRD domain-containing protein [Arthrobacter sp. RIT-PI-e]KNC18674.1 hypothetical protein AC792_10660 [Arthrobacter sp. RIT-PI-e]
MHTTTKTRIAGLSGVTGVAALVAVLGASPAYADTAVERPDTFTSAFTVSATPDQVINSDGDSAPGEPGALGTYNFMINSDEEIICYDIALTGVTPPYQSPANTATHIHEAVAGESGPPRIAFPNPEGEGTLTSAGCLQGPFTTGVLNDGVDTGEGFSLKEIEADPAGFMADTHTAAFVPGAVRGQLAALPMGGADTGVTAAPAATDSTPVALGALALLGAGVGGAALFMRRRAGDA